MNKELSESYLSGDESDPMKARVMQAPVETTTEIDFEELYQEAYEESTFKERVEEVPDKWDIKHSLKRFLTTSPHIEEEKRKTMAKWIVEQKFIFPYNCYAIAGVFDYELNEKEREINRLKSNIEKLKSQYNQLKEFKELFLDEK